MKTHYIIALISLFSFVTSYGQQKLNVERTQSLADEYFYDKQYREALALYKQIDSVVPNNPHFLYKIGVSHLNGDYKTKALSFLQQARDLGKQDTSILFALAKAYHLNHDFDKAMELYKEYGDANEKNKENALRFVQQCYVGKKYVADSLQIVIKNLGSTINTINAESDPLFSNNVLFFTTLNQNNQDIFSSVKQGENWGELTPMSSLNTSKNELCAGLSADGSKLIVYQEGELYWSEKNEAGWSSLQKFGLTINTQVGSRACFSPDNKTLYFISNREGGFGGMDIYASKLQADGTWGRAENLGESINTKYDETSPFFHSDGRTLFFSSQGHEGMGGFDVFSSMYDVNQNKWTPARNLTYPINTADDDIDFVWLADGTKGYYTSTKKDTYGNSDLYSLVGPVESNEVLLQFALFDFLSKEKVANATVSILTVPDQQIVVRNQAYNGVFKTGLVKGKQYKYIVEAEGYVLREGTFETSVETAYNEIHQNLFLKSFGDNQPVAATNDNTVTTTTTTTSFVDETKIAENNPTTTTTTTTVTDTKVIEDGQSTTTTNNPTTTTNNKVVTDTKVIEDGQSTTNNITNTVATTTTTTSTRPVIKNSDLNTNQIFEEGNKIIVRNVLFAFDKAKISEGTTAELDKFATTMKQHPALVVEVSGHTDNIGNADYNLKLSKKRAKVVVKYLVKQGVNKKQFVAIGYGATQPFASNDTENGRQLNRRTEFKVLKIMNDEKYNQVNKVDLSDIETWNEQEEQVRTVTYNTPSETQTISIGELLPLKVHFMFDVYDELTTYSQGKLDGLVDDLQKNPKMRLRIHAHADAQGNAEYNQKLSNQRAETIIKYLTSKGVDASRLEIASHGSNRPLEQANGNLQNRRVEFEVLQK